MECNDSLDKPLFENCKFEFFCSGENSQELMPKILGLKFNISQPKDNVLSCEANKPSRDQINEFLDLVESIDKQRKSDDFDDDNFCDSFVVLPEGSEITQNFFQVLGNREPEEGIEEDVAEKNHSSTQVEGCSNVHLGADFKCLPNDSCHDVKIDSEDEIKAMDRKPMLKAYEEETHKELFGSEYSEIVCNYDFGQTEKLKHYNHDKVIRGNMDKAEKQETFKHEVNPSQSVVQTDENELHPDNKCRDFDMTEEVPVPNVSHKMQANKKTKGNVQEENNRYIEPLKGKVKSEKPLKHEMCDVKVNHFGQDFIDQEHSAVNSSDKDISQTDKPIPMPRQGANYKKATEASETKESDPNGEREALFNKFGDHSNDEATSGDNHSTGREFYYHETNNTSHRQVEKVSDKERKREETNNDKKRQQRTKSLLNLKGESEDEKVINSVGDSCVVSDHFTENKDFKRSKIKNSQKGAGECGRQTTRAHNLQQTSKEGTQRITENDLKVKSKNSSIDSECGKNTDAKDNLMAKSDDHSEIYDDDNDDVGGGGDDDDGKGDDGYDDDDVNGDNDEVKCNVPEVKVDHLVNDEDSDDGDNDYKHKQEAIELEPVDRLFSTFKAEKTSKHQHATLDGNDDLKVKSKSSCVVTEYEKNTEAKKKVLAKRGDKCESNDDCHHHQYHSNDDGSSDDGDDDNGDKDDEFEVKHNVPEAKIYHLGNDDSDDDCKHEQKAKESRDTSFSTPKAVKVSKHQDATLESNDDGCYTADDVDDDDDDNIRHGYQVNYERKTSKRESNQEDGDEEGDEYHSANSDDNDSDKQGEESAIVANILFEKGSYELALTFFEGSKSYEYLRRPEIHNSNMIIIKVNDEQCTKDLIDFKGKLKQVKISIDKHELLQKIKKRWKSEVMIENCFDFINLTAPIQIHAEIREEFSDLYDTETTHQPSASGISRVDREDENGPEALGHRNATDGFEGHHSEPTVKIDTSASGSSRDDREDRKGPEAPVHRDATDRFEGHHSKLTVKIEKSNITHLPVDVIVNSATSRLKFMGGVAKIIAEAAGKEMVEECERHISHYSRIRVTHHFASSGGKLNAKQVYHALGPKVKFYTGHFDECERDLRLTLLRCLFHAEFQGYRSIAFPSISAGAVSGVPKEMCAESYMRAVKHFELIRKMYNLNRLEKVYFVDVDDSMVHTIKQHFAKNWQYNIQHSDDKFRGDNFEIEKNFFLSRDKSESRSGNATASGGAEEKSTTRKLFDKFSSFLGASGSDVGAVSTSTSDVECDICMYETTEFVKLKCCDKEVCNNCHRRMQKCPYCCKIYGILTGDQPGGFMTVKRDSSTNLAGYKHDKGCYEISYFFYEVGLQKPYRRAYIPATSDGLSSIKLLLLAFCRRLTFTKGRSVTTGKDNQITWNDIHHKTSLRPSDQFGYPDKFYLQRLNGELESNGVTKASMTPDEKRVIKRCVEELKDKFQTRVKCDEY